MSAINILASGHPKYDSCCAIHNLSRLLHTPKNLQAKLRQRDCDGFHGEKKGYVRNTSTAAEDLFAALRRAELAVLNRRRGLSKDPAGNLKPPPLSDFKVVYHKALYSI